jgi:hypothetical protein
MLDVNDMKTIIASAASLLVGLALGWWIEHRHANCEKNEIIQHMVEATESFDAEPAARALRAIQLIDANDTQHAVQLLSRPIAHYYLIYADDNGN